MSYRSQKKYVYTFTNQITRLLKGHITLFKSLKIVSESFRKTSFEPVILSLINLINNGHTLSEALATFPKIFTPTYQAIITSGEKASSLLLAFEYLLNLEAQMRTFRRQLKNILIYPCIVLLVTVLMFFGILLCIVPQLENLYSELHIFKQLPYVTHILFTTSAYLRTYPKLLLLFVSILMLSIYGFSYHKSVRKYSHIWILKLPFIGPLYIKIVVTQIGRTLGALLNNKVPLVEALNLIEESLSNESIRATWKQIEYRVQEGATLATSLLYQTLFPNLFVEILYQGELTSTLAEGCISVAEVYEAEISYQLKLCLSWIEPIFMISIALFVCLLIMSLFLPIINLMQNLGSTL